MLLRRERVKRPIHAVRIYPSLFDESVGRRVGEASWRVEKRRSNLRKRQGRDQRRPACEERKEGNVRPARRARESGGREETKPILGS